jgi:hypothetical protein
LLCEAWTGRGLVYSAYGRIFNDMLCVIHTIDEGKVKPDKPIPSSKRMLHKDYVCNGSVVKKKISGHKPQRAWPQDELISSKLPVVK